MASISTIYDAIASQIATSLSSHVRLPNPYQVDSNTYIHLNKAYGIGIGSGRDTERYLGCKVTWEQNYTIVLVRKIISLPNNTDQHVVIEKAIISDWDILRKAFYNNSTLGGIAYKSTILSHSGINFLDANLHKFLALEMDLVVEYEDTPT